MEVLINNLQDEPVALNTLRKLAAFLLEKEQQDLHFQLSVALVDKEKIKELNLKYRGVNRSTDVLAFPFGEVNTSQKDSNGSPPIILGDVIICPAVAKKYAAEYGNSLFEELCLLLTHGILHLLGFDHQTASDRRKMKLKEKEILKSFFTRLRRKPRASTCR